jgi:glycerol kinase
MRQNSVQQSLFVDVLEIENLLLRLLEKVDHMIPMYIMSIDQGTTGSTVSILNQAGSPVAKVNEEYPQIFPKPGWVEHNPEDIWKSVTSTMQKALSSAKISGKEIAAIGITNQRETVLLWDKSTGKPIYNAIVWQCRRTQDFCEKLKKEKKQNLIRKKTGLVIDPYFSGSKIRWLLKNVQGASEKARRGDLLAGNIDTFLLWRLTSGQSHKTDVSNASRTMLMNIQTGQWDHELLKIFSVPQQILPEICDSSGVFGKTQGLGFLPDGIPIAGIAGDQQAALFGQACFAAGEAKCTYGTGSFLLMNTGGKLVASKHQMLTTVAWRLPKQKMTYALEGGAFICGAAVQWLRDGLQVISKSSEVEELARQVSSSEGVEFVPALTGLGAPHWRPQARGVITGLTRGTKKAHLARATLEAMALQNTEILLAMEKDLGKKLKGLRVDGGASVNNLLMQMQADYMGASVTRPKQIETTSIGAAYLAGLGVGFWSSQDEIKRIWMTDQEFKSHMAAKSRKARLLSWQEAVRKA